MGTALYFEFHGDAILDGEVFTSRMNSLCRAIGNRGRAEAVPPSAQSPSPAPLALPAPAPAPAVLAPPSLLALQLLQSFDALPLIEKFLEEAKVERREMRAEIDKQRLAIEQLRQNCVPQQALSAQQLFAIQTRLDALRAAKLLTDEEFYTFENLCVDAGELRAAVGNLTKETMLSMPNTFEAVSKVCKLVALCMI